MKIALPSIAQERRRNTAGQNVIVTKPITIGEVAKTGTVPTPLPEIPRSELPSYIIPERRPPPKPPDQLIKKLVEDKEVRTNREKNSLFQESIISEIYERLDESYFQEPTELKDLIDTKNVIQRFLPKQTDIDKILEIIKKKGT